jgi:nicotinate-nucleotide pyrophosphorylase (carboxylating)
MVFDPKIELKRFLSEDIAKGDITSSLLLPKNRIKAKIISRESAIIAGTDFAKQIFALKGAYTKIIKKDGTRIKKNDTILEITGTPQAILSCERTALNLLSRMSGIATQTNEFVKKIKYHMPIIYATRKTAPGLRYFDKFAVKVGGGNPHRMTLNEMIMIKDNHIAVVGHDSLESIIIKAKKRYKKIEVEVESQKDAITAAKLGASIIMLDNFTPAQIIKTIKELKKNNQRDMVKIEASGGITLKNVQAYARTGIDIISVGAITNFVKGVDLSLEVC